MKAQHVFELADPRLPKTIGNKAQNLHFLSAKGFQIPATWSTRCSDGLISSTSANIVCLVVQISAHVQTQGRRGFGNLCGQKVEILGLVADSLGQAGISQFKHMLCFHDKTSCRVGGTARALFEKRLFVIITMERLVPHNKFITIAVACP